MRKINIGIIGLGTIGEGLFRIINSQKSSIRKKFNIEINIIKVCDLDYKLAKKLKIEKKLFTNNYNQIVEDPKIDCVVELIGGTTIAKTIADKTLKFNKHFVTANKALIAMHGNTLSRVATKKNLHLMYEASVGGGIPLLNSIKESIIINEIKSFHGILNGTCNYILSLMAEGKEFNSALSEAQKLGFAEADPTLDINGYDTAHKVCVMAQECFGYSPNIKKIHIEGIEKINKIDLDVAKELNCKIKLIGKGKIKGKDLSLSVNPMLLKKDNPLFNVENEFNAVLIDSKNLGPIMKYGYGAGMLPTASAVITDLIRLNTDISSKAMQISKKYNLLNINDSKSRFYIRFFVVNKSGYLAKITSKFAKYKINIEKIIQNPHITNLKKVPVVITTKKSKFSELDKLLSEVHKSGLTSKESIMIPFEE